MKRTLSPFALAGLMLASLLAGTLLVVLIVDLIVELTNGLPQVWQRHFTGQ
jgi:hypothetical protein